MRNISGGPVAGKAEEYVEIRDLLVRPEQAKATVRAFVEFYHGEGNRENRSKNRARFFVDNLGPEAIREPLGRGRLKRGRGRNLSRDATASRSIRARRRRADGRWPTQTSPDGFAPEAAFHTAR